MVEEFEQYYTNYTLRASANFWSVFLFSYFVICTKSCFLDAWKGNETTKIILLKTKLQNISNCFNFTRRNVITRDLKPEQKKSHDSCENDDTKADVVKATVKSSGKGGGGSAESADAGATADNAGATADNAGASVDKAGTNNQRLMETRTLKSDNSDRYPINFSTSGIVLIINQRLFKLTDV